MQIDTVVLHSGGLDSTVLLYKALEDKKKVLSLGIEYGQTHRIELEYAKLQCEKLSIPRKILKINWDKPLREMPMNRLIDDIGSDISSAFLPGRNIIFLTFACAEASGLGANEVWIGVNSVDFSGYPDCTPEFIKSYKKMLSIGMPDGPEVVSPLQFMSKPEIAKEGYRLGIAKGDTWSCYRPKISKSGIEPCGRCDACILHNHAWNMFER